MHDVVAKAMSIQRTDCHSTDGLVAPSSWYDRITPARVLYPPAAADMIGGVSAAALKVPAQHGVAITPKLPAALAANRRNRVKYSCSGCNLNVWGRPGLRVACVACDRNMDGDDGA